MQDVSASPRPEDPPRIARLERTALLLSAHAVQLDHLANYAEELEGAIFPRCAVTDDPKLRKKYNRVLKTSEAYSVLAIVWKESKFLTDAELAEAGLLRSYQGRALTAHSLATDMAEVPHDVSKLNSRIRTIGIAAAAHHLIDRNLANSTKVILRGTEHLHEFMLTLSAKNILAISRLIPFLDSPIPAPKPDAR